MSDKKISVLFLLICLLGGILRFYNLSWGSPFYFHPDERNIASSITQLSFPLKMNPDFFAYGSFPLYIIYFTGIIFTKLQTNSFPPSLILSFDTAIITGRFFSAILSFSMLFYLFYLCKKLFDMKTALFCIFLAASSPGLIQYSHFATFEMWMTFGGLLLYGFGVFYLKHYKKKNIFYFGVIFGTLAAIKISTLPLFIPIIYTLFSVKKFRPLTLFFFVISVLAISAVVYFMLAPFSIIDFQSFLHSMRYEINVATGELPVFYTQGFLGTIPILYQFLHVYPFILNPLVFLLFIPSLFITSYYAIKKQQTPIILLLLFFFTLFLSQAFLFVKWVRYVIPTLPFIYIIIASALVYLNSEVKSQMRKKMLLIVQICICVFSLVFSLLFFSELYLKTDTRIQTVTWAKKNIPVSSFIASEPYDLGIIPFNTAFPNIVLINFYEMDKNTEDVKQIKKSILSYDYIILPSQRIMRTRMTNPIYFPKTHLFYTDLFSGKLGFKKIYETPCNLSCKIIYLDDPTFLYEETATVFDNPILYVFKNENKK